MKNHYYKTKMVKMGKWAIPLHDTETWHGEPTNRTFKRLFGLQKGNLLLYTHEDGYHHPYFPADYFKKIHNRIDKINKHDFKALEKILKKYYVMVKKARKEVEKARHYKLSAMTNSQLAAAYVHNRIQVQTITAFDQFAWIAEEYWTPLLRHILEKKLGLVFGSETYNAALFDLTKPEEISTTLREKRAVLAESIAVKKRKKPKMQAAKKLSQDFGWLPIFTYGDSWQTEHYRAELDGLCKKSLLFLEQEYSLLKKYTANRNQKISELVKKYSINARNLQPFIDFGLAIDTRSRIFRKLRGELLGANYAGNRQKAFCFG